jgi:hypothetical protein
MANRTVTRVNGVLKLTISTDWNPWTEKTANYTAVNYDDIGVNTISGAVTVTLPASPGNGARVRVIDSASNFGTASCFIATTDSSTIQYTATPFEIDIDDISCELVFDSNSTSWIIHRT